MVRYLLPYLVKRFIEKQKEKFYNANPHMQKEYADNNNKKEGEIEINRYTKNNRVNSDSVGEYVDFEELD